MENFLPEIADPIDTWLVGWLASASEVARGIFLFQVFHQNLCDSLLSFDVRQFL